jgi:hypothetical protein
VDVAAAECAARLRGKEYFELYSEFAVFVQPPHSPITDQEGEEKRRQLFNLCPPGSESEPFPLLPNQQQERQRSPGAKNAVLLTDDPPPVKGTIS